MKICHGLKLQLSPIWAQLKLPLQEEKPDSMDDSKDVAKRGGKVAGNARRETEDELGRSVVSKKNFLNNNDLPLL